MPKPQQWIGSDLHSRADVVRWLRRQGDEVVDPSGLIVGRMRAELGKGRALSQLLADMEHDGMIKREVRGRRTMMLKLVDDWGLSDPFETPPVVIAPEISPDSLEHLADLLSAAAAKIRELELLRVAS